ncbi:MAG: hypothetical protein KA164_05680 [Rhodoferax sp.]|nr:hypothetical protein [Rhodoferax sp.]
MHGVEHLKHRVGGIQAGHQGQQMTVAHLCEMVEPVVRCHLGSMQLLRLVKTALQVRVDVGECGQHLGDGQFGLVLGCGQMPLAQRYHGLVQPGQGLRHGLLCSSWADMQARWCWSVAHAGAGLRWTMDPTVGSSSSRTHQVNT